MTLAADAPTRLEAIVRFLAVLELFKQGIVDLGQAENFGVLTVQRIAGIELDAESIADWDHDAQDRDAQDRDAQDRDAPDVREVTPQEPGA